MRILFFGTPEFARASLEEIVRLSRESEQTIDIVGVVTQPDRPAGRGRHLVRSAVADYAEEHGIRIYQPLRLKDEALGQAWREEKPDLFVVVAYGRILPPQVLEIPAWGAINVHASLLPKYRGAAPIERAIIAGERETGVTIMEVTAELDAGPVLLARSVPIGDDDTAEELRARLARAGAELLGRALALYRGGRPEGFAPQDVSLVTYAPPLEKEEGELDWTEPASGLYNRVRGLAAWPGTWTRMRGKRVKVVKAGLSPLARGAAACGEVVHVSPQGIEVACGEGVLVLRVLQLEGKKALEAGAFLNGFPLRRGERFE